jgi:hypothetical protein
MNKTFTIHSKLKGGLNEKKMILNDLKISSFVTTLESQNVRGGLLWESAPSCPMECDSDGVTYPCTLILECAGTSDCGSLQYPTNCVWYCN